MKRTPIYSLTDQHGPQIVEASYSDEPAPQGVIYIDIRTWDVVEAELVSDIPDGALELPKTTWFEG